MVVNVLQIYFYVTIEIIIHQQSPGVVYQRFFVTKFKIREIHHIPGDYLVTIFTFSRFIRWGNPSCWRFLKNENSIIAFLRNRLGIVPASSKSSLAPVSVLANREPKSEISCEELSHCSEKVISLFILPILLYSVLKR